MNKVFVSFGDVRIKVSNIKNYGIATEPCCFAKVYVEKTEERTHYSLIRRREKKYTAHLWVPSDDYKVRISRQEYEKVLNLTNAEFVGRYVLIPKDKKYEGITFGEPITVLDDKVIVQQKGTALFIVGAGFLTSKDVWIGERDYLYITTYQNDNFKFYRDECCFNIDEAIKELDELEK